jgi:hypothetical protein
MSHRRCDAWSPAARDPRGQPDDLSDDEAGYEDDLDEDLGEDEEDDADGTPGCGEGPRGAFRFARTAAGTCR